jgi:hypothetical protein
MAILGVHGQAIGDLAGWANAIARVARQSLAARVVVIFKMKDGTATEGWYHFDDLTTLDNFLHRGCASEGVVV